MQLLGVEFQDFACFDKQFVPLPGHVSLVVGKNNSGKTALLRGLVCLGSLPFDQVKPLRIPLGGYCRNLEPEPHFSFDVIYAATEVELRMYFGEFSDEWIRQVLESNPTLRFRFSVWPQRGDVHFQKAVLNSQLWTNEVDVLFCNNESAWSNRFRALMQNGKSIVGDLIQAYKLPVVGSLRSTPDGQHSWLISSKNDSVKKVGALNSRFVSAHRVPHPQMQLQTANDLPDDASNLSLFLRTLQGRDRDSFEEDFIVSVFPEIKRINSTDAENQASITVTLRETGQKIQLTHCGTGVEQLLALATFVVTAPENTVVLLDEPHSFLHPLAERKLVDFINSQKKSNIVITTHSAVFINSTQSQHVCKVEPPGKEFSNSDRRSADVGQILLDLGYRNSDLLFSDYLIAVEGKVDAQLIPNLLSSIADRTLLERTGFVMMDGVGDGAKALQTAILRFEKYLLAVGRQSQPRIYIFDGDKSTDDVQLLRGTMAGEQGTIECAFLPRTEIENYLLDLTAICAAIRDQAKIDGVDIEVSPESIKKNLEKIFGEPTKKTFPRGSGGDPYVFCKGSEVLKEVYKLNGELRFDKSRSGLAIAKHITTKSQPALMEIMEAIQNIYKARQQATAASG